MARLPLPYTAVSKLANRIALRRGEMIQESGGRSILIRDVENEIAEYCNVTRDTIVMIKRGLNQPSLAVALKLAEYFKCSVEDLFSLEEVEED